jgi:hypothetical protein
MKKGIDKKNLVFLIIGVIVVVFLVMLLLPQKTQITRGNCVSDQCLSVSNLSYPVGELPADIKNTLDLAMNDEYMAHAFYQSVIDKFGLSNPFSMIIRAEEGHISMLKALYDKYGLEIPADNWIINSTSPDTFKEACQIGVAAEIANAALYQEQLLPVVSNYEDLTQVYNSLMTASQQKHLIAFQKCA